MKKLNPKKDPKKTFTVKIGSAKDFFTSVKKVMKAADKKESIEKSCTLIFEEPSEMLRFLSVSKINLINSIRKHPDSVTNLAKTMKRNRASVYRDVSELEKFGIVRTHEEINPGHGRHKIVELVASKLKLEAYIA